MMQAPRLAQPIVAVACERHRETYRNKPPRSLAKFGAAGRYCGLSESGLYGSTRPFEITFGCSWHEVVSVLRNMALAKGQGKGK